MDDWDPSAVFQLSFPETDSDWFITRFAAAGEPVVTSEIAAPKQSSSGTATGFATIPRFRPTPFPVILPPLSRFRRPAITIFTNWCYDSIMKRATITIPEDLAAAVEGYVQAQETPPALTTVVQTALRQFLTGRGYLRSRTPLRIHPASRGSGHQDVSQAHDRYLAGK